MSSMLRVHCRRVASQKSCGSGLRKRVGRILPDNTASTDTTGGAAASDNDAKPGCGGVTSYGVAVGTVAACGVLAFLGANRARPSIQMDVGSGSGTPQSNAKDALAGFSLQVRSVLDRVQPSAPPRPAWLPNDGPKAGQMGIPPTHWAITVMQLQQLLHEARGRPQWRKGMNMHEFVTTFIKPWTAGGGCSYALLVNRENPLAARIMVSHTWGADVEQFIQSVTHWCQIHRLPLDTPIWICSLALYQCGDAAGPDIGKQLATNPFGKVIESDEVKHVGMLVSHTLREDLYNRMWCVYEIDAATTKGLPVHGAYPPVDVSKLKQLLSSDVKTRKATCTSPSDEAMIRALVEQRGGYERLDENIKRLRLEMFKTAAPLLEAEASYQERLHGASKGFFSMD
eukprot:TRINITY_DN26053_c0_g2_i1.p1 TRINITY_DN26053_c0_g2~~TRINITY_DN26053_c0_g2_i1.p1  ORF type:complete len:398 (-),score=61.24 TRINITY_DN26053_c0_g2_i1:38-1231(-)